MKEKAVLWKWLVGIPKPRVVSVSEWRAKYPRFFCFLLFLLLDVHLITTRVSQLWATYIARLDWELLTNKQKTRTPNETRCIERHGQGTRRREIAVVCRTRENAVCDRRVRGGQVAALSEVIFDDSSRRGPRANTFFLLKSVVVFVTGKVQSPTRVKRWLCHRRSLFWRHHMPITCSTSLLYSLLLLLLLFLFTY